MHFLIFGAGGVGSVVAAHLTRAGHRVSVIARPRHVRAIRDGGLRITGQHDLVAWPEAYSDGAEIHTAEVLLLTTKTGDTQEALRSVAHVDVGMAASLQNGVSKDAELATVFGQERVIGGAIAIGARLRADGVAEQNRNAGCYSASCQAVPLPGSTPWSKRSETRPSKLWRSTTS